MPGSSLAVAGVLRCAVWLAIWSQGPYISARNHEVAHGGDEPEAVIAAEPEPHVSWIRIFTTRTFLSCALLTTCVYALVTVVLTWLPSYFQTGLGYSQLQAGTMFAIPSLMAVGGLIAPFATGLIVDAAATPADGYTLSFQILGVLCVVAAIIALVFANPSGTRPVCLLRTGGRTRSS